MKESLDSVTPLEERHRLLRADWAAQKARIEELEAEVKGLKLTRDRYFAMVWRANQDASCARAAMDVVMNWMAQLTGKRAARGRLRFLMRAVERMVSR